MAPDPLGAALLRRAVASTACAGALAGGPDACPGPPVFTTDGAPTRLDPRRLRFARRDPRTRLRGHASAPPRAAFRPRNERDRWPRAGRDPKASQPRAGRARAALPSALGPWRASFRWDG